MRNKEGEVVSVLWTGKLETRFGATRHALVTAKAASSSLEVGCFLGCVISCRGPFLNVSCNQFDFRLFLDWVFIGSLFCFYVLLSRYVSEFLVSGVGLFV